MSNKPENPQAFPSSTTEGGFHYDGMTLRDYFAAKAMQSIIMVSQNNLDFGVLEVSKEAYLYADAMLKERQKEE